MLKKSIILVGVLTTAIANCFAQTTGPDESHHSTARPSTWVWTTEKWTADDKPYVEIRQNIDKAIASGHKPDALLKKYEGMAQKGKLSAQAQFRWAYAAWQARKAVDRYDDQRQRLWIPRRSFTRVASPRCYQYTRLRFLIEAWFLPTPRLKSVGERLVRRAENDYDVKAYMARILRTSTSLEERKKALAYAKDLVRLEPKRPSAYSTLGGVYFTSWLKTKNPDDGDKAVAAYRKYLDLAPRNAEWRPQAERLIHRIELNSTR